MAQGNPLGMYQGLSGQGIGGQANQVQGMHGGFGNNVGGYGSSFGMGNGMENMATQRAMLEAAQAGQMQQQMQNQANSFNLGGFSGGGGMGNMNGVGGMGNMSGVGGMSNMSAAGGMGSMSAATSGGGGGADWLGQSFGRSEQQDNKDDEQQQFRGQM